MNRLFFLSLAFSLISCGTLRKPRNIVPVVSKKGSHSFAYRDEDQKLKKGKTPTWINLPTQRVHHIYLDQKQLKTQVGNKVRCELRWSASLVPGLVLLPFLPTGTLIGGGLMATDFATGGAYECVKPVVLKEEKGKRKFRKPRILAFPLPVRDAYLNKQVLKAFRRQILKKRKWEVIPDQDSEDQFSDYGISSFRTFSDFKSYKENLKAKLRFQLASQLEVSHYAFFEVKENKKKDETVVIVRFENAYEEGDNLKLKDFKFKLKGLEKGDSFFRTLFSAFRFLPNSLTVGQKSRPNVVLNEDQANTNINLELNEHPDSFPKYVTLFGLESVEHPQFYSAWDFGTLFGPGLGTQGFQARYTTNSNQRRILNTLGYFFDFSFSLIGFSPFGQLALSLGPSLNYVSQEEELTGETFSSTHLGVKFTVSHKFFITNRLYTILSYTVYSASNQEGLDPTLNIKNFESSYVGLGYYFPQLTNLMRSWTSGWF
jgi:hypothetical protein